MVLTSQHTQRSDMETYHKIQTLFKRHTEGKNKGKMIRGEWTTPELEYLAGNQWEFTEKVDGTNIRVFIRRLEDGIYTEFAGRTDRAVIPETLLERLHALFPSHASKAWPGSREHDIREWMDEHDLDSVVLFGEGYGPKIQNGGNYGDVQDFVLFDVKVGTFWLDRKGVDDVGESLDVKTVPTIGTGTLHDAIDIVSSGITFEQSGAVKRWGAGTLQSQWGNFAAEGIVARPVVPMFDRKGERIITKIKAVDFK